MKSLNCEDSPLIDESCYLSIIFYYNQFTTTNTLKFKKGKFIAWRNFGEWDHSNDSCASNNDFQYMLHETYASEVR